MILHTTVRKYLPACLLISIVVISLTILWLTNHPQTMVVQSVPVNQHPYNQIAYTKLALQGGNFTGDVYLLDVDSGETHQLTRGGETFNRGWYDNRLLNIIERPRGSVTNSFFLNVNSGMISASDIHLQPEFNSTTVSHDGQRIVTQIIADESSWARLGYIVIDLSMDDSQTILSITDASGLPVWLRDNQTVLYSTTNNQICLHHVDSDSRDCIVGEQPVLSHYTAPTMVAYITTIDSAYQLCVATIVGHSFARTTCYDSHPYQIMGMTWRP